MIFRNACFMRTSFVLCIYGHMKDTMYTVLITCDGKIEYSYKVANQKERILHTSKKCDTLLEMFLAGKLEDRSW